LSSPYGRLPESKRSKLRLLNSTFYDKKNHMQITQPFRRSSLLKGALQPKIAKNRQKPLFWGSRLSKVINADKSKNLKSPSLVLVMISCMPVPICNRFHTRRDNSGRITFLVRGTPPLWRSRSTGTPSHSSKKFCHKKLESLEQLQ